MFSKPQRLLLHLPLLSACPLICKRAGKIHTALFFAGLEIGAHLGALPSGTHLAIQLEEHTPKVVVPTYAL